MAKKKNEAQIKFTANTAELTQELKGINDALKTNRAALKLNAAELKNNGNDISGLIEKESLLESAVEQSAEKVKVLSQKLEQAEDVLGKNSEEYKSLERAVMSAKTEQQKFITELTSTKEAIKNADSAIDGLEGSVDETAESLEDSAEGASAFADVLKANLLSDAITTGVGKLADAFKGISSEVIGLASDGVKGINNFSAATGLTGKELDGFNEAMQGVYADNFGESLQDVSKQMETVYKATRKSGKELQAATESAMLLSDTFDYDVGESTRAASTLMGQFGISYDEAMNLIAQGAQGGLDYSDELLDSINEYSVQFEKFGFTAEDMFNIMKNGVDNGAFNLDKVGDAVKEFGIRVVDGSKTTEEGFTAIGLNAEEMAAKFGAGGETAKKAFDETITALENMDDPVKQGIAGVNLFGTMWEDLGAQAVLSLNDANDSISLSTDALENMNNVKYDDIGSAIEGIKRNLELGVSGPIQEKVLPALQDVAENTDFSALGESIGGVASALANGVVWLTKHGEVLGIVGGVIAGVTTAIAAYNVITGIKTAMEATETASLGALAAAEWAALAPYALIAVAIAGVIAAGVLLYKNWDKIKEKAGELKKVTVDKITGLKDTAIQKFEAFKTGAVNKVEALKTGAVNKFESLKTGAVNKFESLKTSAVEKVEGLKASATAKVDAIKTGITNAFENAKNAAVNKFEALKSGVVGKIESAKDKVKGIVDKIKGFFTGKWNLPKIPLPHFSVSPPGWKIGDLLKGSIPSLGIQWYAKGGYFDGPAVLSGLGEAGPEYALPLNKRTLKPLAEGIVEELASLPNKAVSIVNNFNGMVVREEADINKIADAVNEKLAGEVF